MWDAGWDKVFESNRWGRYPAEDLLRFIARNFYQAADRSKVRILEVGCGPGANLWFVAREGFEAHGLDGSQVALDKAKARLAEENINAALAKGDAMNLPYPDEYFDGVFDIECVYANTLADSKKIISEVHRVLKPGGHFFSRTFMTGSEGDGKGKPVGDEPHTYVDIEDSVIQEGYGVVRFTDESEIHNLYLGFKSIEYDYLIRSDRNRRHEIREWLITCHK